MGLSQEGVTYNTATTPFTYSLSYSYNLISENILENGFELTEIREISSVLEYVGVGSPQRG